MKSGKHLVFILIILPFLFSCTSKKFRDDFDKCNDRIWIGRNYWAVPLEEWKLSNGRIECLGNLSNMRVNILNINMNGKDELRMMLDMGMMEKGDIAGTAGVRLAIQDDTDNDLRSLCYFGKGINIGYATPGFLFIDDQKTEVPDGFDPEFIRMKLHVENDGNETRLDVEITDRDGKSAKIQKLINPDLKGIIAIVNNHYQLNSNGNSPKFWFDNLVLKGKGIEKTDDRSHGPILWTMYTLSENILKMSAQFPPLGVEDNKEASLQLKEDGQWSDAATATIDPEARIAIFRIEDWDSSKDVDYRVVYPEDLKKGNDDVDFYYGTIRKDPDEKQLKMGGLTCQYHYGFPYRPLTENLAEMDPDILYFSGDQIYEANGGYGIIRHPADKATLNYLGKWYMFGWAFGDLMRDRPTICIPDDHEVFQGNLWGNNGETVTRDEWAENTDCTSGFVQPIPMVNVVMKTNTSHLPDPYDPTPMKNGIKVYYTDMVYGRTSFAIVGDRVFKSGPQNVSFWNGRKDHVKFELKDPSVLEKPGLNFLGDRQLEFLEYWIRDWYGADMKVLLSQTVFANSTTHHGPGRMFLYGDLDSGGWPKTARDEALDVISKCFAFHICGDQHIPMQLQYGVNEYRDAGWAFCTPAIAVGYERRFFPDMMGWEVKNRPEHNLPNTGEYTDGFGNKNYVYAVGNPDDVTSRENRYKMAQSKASGFGMIYFNKPDGAITTEAWRFLTTDNRDSEADQFPGWPITVKPLDVLYNKYSFYLPELKIQSPEKPVIEIIDQNTQETIYIFRLKEDVFLPLVPSESLYTIRIGSPEKNIWKEIEDLKGMENTYAESIIVDFES